MQLKASSLRKVHLVGSQGELTTNHAVYLHVYLGTVKGSFILYLYKRNI